MILDKACIAVEGIKVEDLEVQASQNAQIQNVALEQPIL
jgi:hypothetical protein